MDTIHKIIYISLALLFIILFANRVDTHTSLDKNLNNMIGCLDYDYVYELNVPATLSFYVTEKNAEDKEGFFKRVTAEETKGRTILHCGNSYLLVASASGYEDYTEKIPGMGFRPMTTQIHKLNLERK